MDFFSLFLLGLLSSLTASAPQKKSKFPFPALAENVIPYDYSTPFFKFDGIDYDELPPNFKNYYYTCYSDHIRCIRNRNYFHDVCVYASWYGWGSFYSMCQLELMNCQSRLSNFQGLYGTYYANDLALYQGDGGDCYGNPVKDTRRLAFKNFFAVPLPPFKTIHY